MLVEGRKKTKRKKPSKPRDVTPRDYPGPHGPMISKNPDLGSGPYSQNNGKPYGGVSASEFIKKQRRRPKGRAAECKAADDVINNVEKLSIEFYNRCMNVKKEDC